MKYKIKFYFNILDNFLNSTKFKIVFLLSIIYNLYIVITLPQDISYIDKFLFIFTDPYYIIFIFLVLFFNKTFLLELFDKNSTYIIRFKNKGKYLKSLIVMICFGNFVLFIINLIILLIIINIFSGIDFKTNLYMDYHITTLSYFIFYFIRFIMLVMIWQIICVLITKSINNKITLFITFVFFGFLLFYPYEFMVIENISNIKFGLYDYFRSYNYKSFNLEIVFSIIYLISMSIISYILYIYSKKRIRSIEI